MNLIQLRYFYESSLNQNFSKTAEKYFDIKRINKLLEDHKSGKKDCYKKVWTIYTFIVWYNEYFKEA